MPIRYQKILVLGGSGFVGSYVCTKLKEHFTDIAVAALDNLKRRGSEFNIPRLKKFGVEFVHGDIRNKEDVASVEDVDLIIDCSAEPSVMAGVGGSPEYVINTNLIGTINCLEYARVRKVDLIFLSTSRVYSVEAQSAIKLREDETRFSIEPNQVVSGISPEGINENFPITGTHSMYGTTKLCSEHLITEYAKSYGLHAAVCRFGVIAGPWQMGKVDQGVFVLWMARHFWGTKSLGYFGYGGKGKQVRDFLHIDDMFEAIKHYILDITKFSGKIYNIGGGVDNSSSLLELTRLCREKTGNSVAINSVLQDRINDVPLYITDHKRFSEASGWVPRKKLTDIADDVYTWLSEDRSELESVLN